VLSVGYLDKITFSTSFTTFSFILKLLEVSLGEIHIGPRQYT